MASETIKYQIVLVENDKRYNLKFNEYFKKYFISLNNFKNIESIFMEKLNPSINKIQALKMLLDEIKHLQLD